MQCDLEKPHCRKCIDSSRQCEGYERYPVFINRGQQGLEKRGRLEEAKSRSRSPVPELGAEGASAILAPSSKQINESQLISSFWELYATSSNGNPRGTELAWLSHSIHSSPSSVVLKQALLSLAYIRIGRLNSEQTFVVKGQQIYGQALQLMQNALYDPALLQNDETLVAARCMVLYESFESTSGDMAAWQNHIMGIARIIECRGVQRHRDLVSRSVLESMRYNIMVVSLMRSRASFLGEADWLQGPWADTTKDLDQRLFDFGFLFAEVMQQSDTLQRPPARQEIIDMLEQISDGYVGLMALNEELLATRDRDRQSFRFSDAEVVANEISFAVSSATLIALDLSMSIFTYALLGRCNEDLLQAREEHVSQLRRYSDPNRRQKLAQQLLHHLQTSLQKQFESMRPRIIYPLNVVRWELRNSPEDMEAIQALFKAIAFGNHFRIAQGVHNAGRATLPRMVDESSSRGVGMRELTP